MLDSLKNELKNSSNDSSKCAILVQLIENEWDIAIWPKYNNQVKSIAEKHLNEKETKSIFLYYYAYAISNEGYYYQEKGENILALENYNNALEIQTKINDKELIAASLLNIGYVYRQMGNIKAALNSYHKALKIQIEINDSTHIATTYNNIAYVFESQGEFENALKYYSIASNIYKKTNDKDGLAICYTNMAYIIKSYGDPNCKLKDEECNIQSNKTVIKYLELAIKLKTEINDKEGIADAYNLLAKIYAPSSKSNLSNEITDEAKAFKYYLLALKLRQEINSVPGLSMSYSSLAEFFLNKCEYKKASEYGIKSLEYAEKLGSPEHIQDASRQLATIYEKLGMYQNSLKMFRLSVEMRDSLFNHETRNAALKKTFQIEYEKKAAADSMKVAEEKKVVALQLQQERTQRLALYGGIALVALFGLFMYNRFKVTQKQKHIIELKEQETQHKNEIIVEQKALVEEKQKEILDSINYAKRIQYTLLAHADFLKEHLTDHFVYFNPKDIVSGDFYWATKVDNYFYLAVCDSTGHGVPGAFMSLLNIGFLSEAINEKNILEPHEIFNYARERLTNSVSKEGQKDGFDGILLQIETHNNKIISLKYAAANNAPILVRENEYFELAKDKMPVGKGEKENSFTTHKIDFHSGDTLYLYTDGYADQFGGEKGKKFKYKPLNELLLSNSHLALPGQKDKLEKAFSDWKGNLEQVDDVLLIGIRI